MSFVLVSGKPLVGASLDAARYTNPLNLCFTGLGTDPNGAANGQRAQAKEFQAMFPGSDFLIWSWSKIGWGLPDAIKECEQLYAQMIAGNANGPYTHFIGSGHSFGGSFWHFFIWWLSVVHPDADVALARFLDPVPNFYDNKPWNLPVKHVDRSMQWTQCAGAGWYSPFFPNGTPLVSDDPARPIESVKFGFWSGINHLSLVADDRVWLPSKTAMIQAVGGICRVYS